MLYILLSIWYSSFSLCCLSLFSLFFCQYRLFFRPRYFLSSFSVSRFAAALGFSASSFPLIPAIFSSLTPILMSVCFSSVFLSSGLFLIYRFMAEFASQKTTQLKAEASNGIQ